MKKSKFWKSLVIALLVIPCVFVFTACSLTPVQTIVGKDGANGVTPHIGPNGNWWVGTEDLGILALGKNGANGLTPYIGENLFWWIGDHDTGILAYGRDGNPGLTPYIGSDGFWWIGEQRTGYYAIGRTPYINNGTWWIDDEDTGYLALGKDAPVPHISDGIWWIGDFNTGFSAIGQDGKDGKNGITPRIGPNGNWWLEDYDTGWTALGHNGKNGEDGKDGVDGLTPYIKDGTWWIGGFDSGVIASVDVLQAEYQALLNYLIEMNKTIAYLQGLFSPAPSSFDVDSWQTIANASASGIASNFYNVGDEKTFMLKDGEVITVVILGFNHDYKSDGSGKAGMTLGMKNLMATTVAMNSVAGNGWQDSQMRNTTLMDIFDRLPDALQAIIKSVNKTSTTGNGSVSEPNINTVITADKLWLFSRVEIDGNSLDGFKDEGTQYEYWVDKVANADRIKRLVNGSGNATIWWLRSSTTTSAVAFNAINPNGAFNTGASSTMANGVSFGFCI